MLIQIPILIAFDCVDSTYPNPLSRAAGQRMFTLRYDTNPDASDWSEYCDHYPPRPDASWHRDREGIFFDLMSRQTDQNITKRATDDSESYAVTEVAS